MNNLDFLDAVSIMSLALSIANYQDNQEQTSNQDVLGAITLQTNKMLEEIHNHLDIQDHKIDLIMERLNDKD